MGVLSKGTDFSNGDQVTDTNLDSLVDNATFTSSAVDDVSTAVSGVGAIIVRDGGITTGKLADSTGASDGVTAAKIATGAVTTAKLAASAVTSAKIATDAVTSSEIAASAVTSSELATNAVVTAKIADSNVTKAKIENVANMKVLGNTSGSAAAPQEVSILDEDDMSSDSATAIATQQSIKAYFDEYALKEPTSGKTGTFDVTTSWTDLDLSAAVGANKAMVVMEVYDGSTVKNINFRTNGSVIERYTTDSVNGAGAAGLIVSTSNIGGVITIITDASGIIEHKGNNIVNDVNYNILAYQKLI